jgi:glycosyltransferase involved in cell wall biosynthesis
MRKNIWYFHHYSTPPTMSGLTRPYNFGKELIEKGYNIKVFSSSFLHFSGENIIKDKSSYLINKDTMVPFVFIKTPSYRGSGFMRVWNMVVFYLRLMIIAKKFYIEDEKPDIIIASSPHPFTLLAGIRLAKKYNIPCVCEIRDMWPEVFFLGGRVREKSIFGKLLLQGEHWFYKKANSIIFLKEGDVTYLSDKKWDLVNGGDIDLTKCHYINNGIDITTFNNQRESNILKDYDLENQKFKLIYTGTVRPVNNVQIILDCAKLLKDENDIEFLIYGDGNLVDKLKQRVIDEKIRNVKIKGRVDKKYIPYILSKSDINILCYSATQYNWSRGNSSNKLFEYMASGKPVISTVRMGYSIINKYKCGLELENASGEDLANAILDIKRMPKEKYEELGQNAMVGATDFDFKFLTKKLLEVINSLTGEK